MNHIDTMIQDYDRRAKTIADVQQVIAELSDKQQSAERELLFHRLVGLGLTEDRPEYIANMVRAWFNETDLDSYVMNAVQIAEGWPRVSVQGVVIPFKLVRLSFSRLDTSWQMPESRAEVVFAAQHIEEWKPPTADNPLGEVKAIAIEPWRIEIATETCALIATGVWAEAKIVAV